MIDEEKPTTVGELTLKDLPPIEDLNISVPADKLMKIGKVTSIVDVLVVIESIRSLPPLDIDSVLFKSDGQPVGQIFDVFGTVTEPHYSVRFTNNEQIQGKGIHLGLEIYFAPQKDRNITKFAFVEEIRKIKGTDASWENDNEPPSSALNAVAGFSDDEEEPDSKRARG